MRDCKQHSGQRAYATGPAQRRGEGAGAAGSRGSLAPSGGERREAEQAIGRHAKRNVVVPARLLKLTKYVRRDVHLRLPSKSGLKCRDETQSSNDYLLHLQDRWSTLESVRRKKGNRTCDLADHVARESSPRDSDECHRAPAYRANGSDKFENLLESQRPLLQVRSLHNAKL
jgi:hypothetical protein